MHLLITAGPTREPIDEVRFISNRSSGQLGLALAKAAIEQQHRVTLLLGPGVTPPEANANLSVHPFQSTADLESQLAEHFPRCDVLIMAAAVADYRPATLETGKRARGERWTLELEPTPDLVAALGRSKRADQGIVAFALEEPAALDQRALEKLRRKSVNAIVANPLTTMESAQIEPTWLTAAGARDAPGCMSKTEFAHWLLAKLATL